MPVMQKLYEQTDVDIEILAVNMIESEKNEEDVTTYRVQAYPTSYMIDSTGRIQFIALGAMNHDLMVQEIEKMK